MRKLFESIPKEIKQTFEKKEYIKPLQMELTLCV